MLQLTLDAIVSARVCYAAAKLRIADHIVAGRCTSDELAGSTGILHDWNDADCKRILDNCRAAMSEHGKLVIIETIIPGVDVTH